MTSQDGPGLGAGEEPVVLDLAYLGGQIQGDIELEAELLTLFLRQARRLVGELPRLSARERQDAAHLMKGSARAVGAQAMAAALAAYESAAASSGPAASEYDALTTALESVEKAVAARFAALGLPPP